jgi:serine/threonine-protein kinase
MVTGRAPFSGATVVEVLQKHRFGRFDRPRMFVDDIPPWLDDVICQLLEKDPAERFPDAFVLARRLQQVVSKADLIEDRTTADGVSALVDADAPTLAAASGRSTGPGPATLMKYLLRSELEGAREPWLISILNQTWVLVTLLALIVAGGFWWSRPQEAEKDDDSGDAIAASTEAGRLLSLAKRRSKDGDLAEAERIAHGLQELLADDPQRADLLAQTQRLLERVQSRRQKQREAKQQWLADLLSRAKKQNDAGEVAEAAAVWRTIVNLYADQPEAADAVRQAREALQSQIQATDNSHGEAEHPSK